MRDINKCSQNFFTEDNEETNMPIERCTQQKENFYLLFLQTPHPIAPTCAAQHISLTKGCHNGKHVIEIHHYKVVLHDPGFTTYSGSKLQYPSQQG